MPWGLGQVFVIQAYNNSKVISLTRLENESWWRGEKQTEGLLNAGVAVKIN